jgi:hypothetical protein
MDLRESKGTAMAKLARAKLLGCRICMVDFARIQLADGPFALLFGARRARRGADNAPTSPAALSTATWEISP